MTTIIDTPNYQFVEATHTKKESKLYVIQLKNRVEDKFKLLTRRVENHGGYYSGHQKGFVFNRILSQKEIDEIFKGIFFEEKVELQKVDENKDAWNYTLEELKSIPVSKRGEDTFNFKYNLDGKLVNYSIKVPSGSIDDAFISLAKKIIGNALMSGKYNKAVEKGEMNPVRAAQIIKSLGYSLEQINQDFIELHPDIQAVWSMKKANQEEVLDKVRFPYLYERSEMNHLSDKRYSQIINDAIDSNKYEKLIKEGTVSANKVAFIIESAGFEIPEGLLGEAISERKEEIESLVGGYADSQSIYDISEKHGVPIKEIIRQFKKGLKVEREHTKDKQKMGEIVKDHLVENPYYYDVLIQAEKTMEELDPSKFSSHDEYMEAFSQKQRELEGLSVEEIVELKARPIIDKIKYAHKQIGDGVPDEVESFLKNQILNHFVSLFNDVVSEYIFYTPVWLDLQNEYLTENQRNKMLMYGIYNNAHYEEDVVNKFIENVIDSEMIFGSENKKLNNIFNLLPYSPFEVPNELEYDLNPKDKNLAEIVDAFVNKTKVLTSTLGVYFGKDGVFASKFTLDIFLKGKKGYLPKNNIEEGIYGLSNSAKNILPAYGAKRLNMLKDKKAIQFFQEYMATYGNEKGEFNKGISVLTHDQIQTMFKDMSVVYSSKAYKDYVKKEVDGLKLKVSSYSILYIKQGANLFTICLGDFIEALAAIIKMGIDTVQFGVSKNGLYISENVSSLIRLEESGIRVSIKSNESEMPHGMLYYDLNKKEFLTNKVGKDSMNDGGYFDNLDKKKDEINNIISGKSKVRNEDVIKTTANYIGRSKSAGSNAKGSEYIKSEETKLIKKYLYGGELEKAPNYNLLNKAKLLIKDGISPKKVWEDTGWIYDESDKKFKFEIDDSNSDIGISLDKLVENYDNFIYKYKLSDIFNHENLYYLYPNSKDIIFVLDNEPNQEQLISALSGYKDEKFYIFITLNIKNYEKIRKSGTSDEGIESIRRKLNAVITHETQHYIQGRHDFGKAASYNEIKDAIRYYVERGRSSVIRAGNTKNSERRLAIYDFVEDNISIFSYYTYINQPAEKEAWDVYYRLSLTEEERKNIPPYYFNNYEHWKSSTHYNDGGEVSEKPKIVVHNNTNSAADKDAQKIIIEYLKNINESGHKKFYEFLKKSKQDINDYEAVFYVSKEYHDKYSNKFYSNKIIYQKYVADAYQNALNYDDANPSFIRIYRHGNIKGFAAVTEFDLFGDWDGDKYDENGYLKKELKEQAIKQLKKNLFIEDNSEMKDGGILTKKRRNKLVIKPYTGYEFAKYLKKLGYIEKDGSYKVEVLVIGDGDENDRTFEIELYDYDSVSAIGTNFYDEDQDTMEVFFKDIEYVLKDLNA